MNALGLCAAVGLLVSTAAYAQDKSEAPAAKTGEKKICRMIVPIGSTLGKRFCLTRAEWKELSERTQEDAQVAISRRSGGMCPDR